MSLSAKLGYQEVMPEYMLRPNDSNLGFKCRTVRGRRRDLRVMFVASDDFGLKGITVTTFTLN